MAGRARAGRTDREKSEELLAPGWGARAGRGTDSRRNRSGSASRGGSGQVNPASSSEGWRAGDRRCPVGPAANSPAARALRPLPSREEACISPSAAPERPRAQAGSRRIACRTGSAPGRGGADQGRWRRVRRCRPSAVRPWMRARPWPRPPGRPRQRTAGAPGRHKRRSRTERTRTHRSARGRSGVGKRVSLRSRCGRSALVGHSIV